MLVEVCISFFFVLDYLLKMSCAVRCLSSNRVTGRRITLIPVLSDFPGDRLSALAITSYIYYISIATGVCSRILLHSCWCELAKVSQFLFVKVNCAYVMHIVPLRISVCSTV